MIKSIYNPAKGRMRVVGITSGSGNTLWSAYNMQKQMEQTFEGCPFEVVGVFSDTPGSKSMQTAAELGVPAEAIDIRAFYAERGAPMKDRTVRAEYDREMVKCIEKWEPDFVVLAGYVWAVTNVVSDRFAMFGVHPGDLTVEENGVRLLTGSNGVKAAFKYNRPEVRASSYLVSDVLDGGPVLVTSPAVPVDYTLHDNEEDRFRYYLKLVNQQSRLVGARTVLELALGNFQVDDHGAYYYKGEPMPAGIKFESWEENKPAYQRSPEKLLAPESIAVLGASQKPGIGRAIVNNILSAGFTGPVYAVNVRGEDVLDAKGYRSVLDIPGPVDMAVIALPSRFVLDVAEQCGQKGVKALVCIAAGFREVGGDGAGQEKKLLEIVHRYGMCMTGPNCMGVVNTAAGVNMNATILSDAPTKGNVAMLTQSGALGAAMEDFCDLFHIGFSVVVSTGNQADMNLCDFLPLLEKDDNTRVILLYMEGIPEPLRFRRIVSRMTKPVVVFKSGKTAAGATAAGSHTGSLAGNESVAAALLRQSGAICCDSLEDAFRLAATLSKINMLKGNRIGIVSNTGGLDIIMADALTKRGFTLPPLPEACVNELRPKLLPEATVRNPIDIVAPATPEQYRAVAETMTSCGAFDGIIVTVVPAATVTSQDIAAAMLEPLKRTDLPVMSCFFGPVIAGRGAEVMRENDIPTFEYPEKMADLLSYMYRAPKPAYSGQVPVFDEQAAKQAAQEVRQAQPGTFLPMALCEKLVRAYGIPTARSGYLTDPGQAAGLELTYPVVAKIDHKKIIHKSDVGGVRLNIADAEELAAVFAEWQTRFEGMDGVFVQEQVAGSVELIIGCACDNTLGHAVLAGMGGTLVELTKDVSFGHVPVSGDDAAQMVHSLRYYPLLEGYRGAPGVSVPRLEELILRVNRMLTDIPEIGELDINPLLFDESRQDFVAVDFRVKRR